MTAIEREKEFWDNRYAKGETSGRGPSEVYERNRLLWTAIEEELPEINHVIDVGCGDLRIWGERDCQDYVGIDISERILQYNRNNRPHWKFLCAPAETFIRELVRENVFCFNLIFHILDPRNVGRIFHNLCRYATKKIFVYTWIQNPFYPKITDGEYQRYNPMGKYLSLFNEMGFELVSVEWIEQPKHTVEDLIRSRRTPCALYIFRRKT